MRRDTYDVFVSYSRADARHAADIDSALRARGLKPFFDRRNLPPGLPWVQALEKAIGACKAAIVLIGPRGFGNTQQYERDLAFFRQTRDPAFRIVPVILPETTDLPFNFLQILTWIDFSHVAKVSDAPAELEHLLTAVQSGRESADVARAAPCPYRGLDAFREEDSVFFFGRGSEDDAASPIGQLVHKVREHSFVMVVGRSGSGKSSLVYAGLVPALRRERERFWNVLALRPGPTPLRALAAAFNPRAEDEGAAQYAAKLGDEAERLRTGDVELLSHMIREYLDRTEGKPDRLLLYIDQWEELYAQGAAGESAAQHRRDVDRFIDLMLAASRSAPVSVVATVRADFYDPLIAHQAMRSLLPTRQVLLASMPRSELERTIVEPAKKVGLTFDPPSLVQQILDEAGEDEGMLPLLQYALKETWALREGQSITADSYARSGGVREAIRITAERTFDALSLEDQQAARRLFLRLVTPGEGQEDTRARAQMPAEVPMRKIVEQFAGPRTRLLVTGWDRAARPTVEVAHEALIRTWPRLRAWIDSNREKLRARAAVVQAKAEWEQQGRREDLLLPAGFQLARARALLADPGDLTIDDIQEFIALSSAREEAEHKERKAALARDEARVAEIKAGQERTARLQQRIRWAFVTVAAFILVSAGVIWIMLSNKERALAENKEQLAAQESVLVRNKEQLAMQERTLAKNKEQLATQERELAASGQQLEHERANLLAELSGAKLSRNEFESALRLASHGARVDLKLPSAVAKTSSAAAALAAALVQVQGHLILSHDSFARSAVFNSDGTRIVTALEDGTARIWDAASGKQTLVLRGHEKGLNSAAFNPSGSRIVTASRDKTARVWDAVSGQQIAVLRSHDDMVLSAAFSPDGSRIVTASADKTARVWDADGTKEIAVLRGHGDRVYSAVFSRDGSRIVTASADRSARVWDADGGKEVASLRGHGDQVRSAAFSADGSRIVTASNDNTARIWDVASAKEIAVLRGHKHIVFSAAFSADGSRIVTGSTDRTVRIWDAASSAEIDVLRGHNNVIYSVAFSPDGLRVATASSDGTARIWDISGPREMAVLRGHNVSVWSAAFSPDGSRIVTAMDDKTIRIWDTVSTVEIAVLRGHGDYVASAAFSADGSRIVTASGDKTARIWDAASTKEIAVLRGHADLVRSAAFSTDGTRIVTASYDGTARVWDAASAKEIFVLRGHTDYVNSAAFNRDGSRIVTASGDYTARVWDAASGKQILLLRGHGDFLRSAAFSADGSRIVTAANDKTARVWDAASGKQIGVLGHESTVVSAAFSRDGSRIVTASSDRTVRVWDARLYTLTPTGLLATVCERFAGISKLTREEMRLANYPDSMGPIDVCSE